MHRSLHPIRIWQPATERTRAHVYRTSIFATINSMFLRLILYFLCVLFIQFSVLSRVSTHHERVLERECIIIEWDSSSSTKTARIKWNFKPKPRSQATGAFIVQRYKSCAHWISHFGISGLQYDRISISLPLWNSTLAFVAVAVVIVQCAYFFLFTSIKVNFKKRNEL